MKYFGGRVQIQVFHGRDVRFLPTARVLVVGYLQHVVREYRAELDLGAALQEFSHVRVDLGRFAHRDVDVRPGVLRKARETIG